MSGVRPRNPTDYPRWVRQQAGDLTVPLGKEMMDMAVRVIGTVKTDKNKLGHKRGTIGTGFVIGVPSETLPDVHYTYVLTAHHVIDDEVDGVQIQAANPFAPGQLYPPFWLRDWRKPLEGADLAVAHIPADLQEGGDQTIRGVGIEERVMPPKHVPKLGSQIYYIGYLEPLERMMARSGTIGALEQAGVRHHQPEYDFECHLVDCRSFQGFSGSPAFAVQSYPILQETPRRKLLGKLPEDMPPLGGTAHWPLLCGMFTEHLDENKANEDRTISRYGVGIMLPSLEIWRALMTDDMRRERIEWDDERREADPSQPTLQASSISDDDDEFTRFEKLTTQLVQVPKAELDAEREKGADTT